MKKKNTSKISVIIWLSKTSNNVFETQMVSSLLKKQVHKKNSAVNSLRSKYVF